MTRGPTVTNSPEARAAGPGDVQAGKPLAAAASHVLPDKRTICVLEFANDLLLKQA